MRGLQVLGYNSEFRTNHRPFEEGVTDKEGTLLTEEVVKEVEGRLLPGEDVTEVEESPLPGEGVTEEERLLPR